MAKKKRTKTTPEERARWAENERRLLETIQKHDQRLENERAAREGRKPRVVPVQVPTSEEVRELLEAQLARHEARRAAASGRE